LLIEYGGGGQQQRRNQNASGDLGPDPARENVNVENIKRQRRGGENRIAAGQRPVSEGRQNENLLGRSKLFSAGKTAKRNARREQPGGGERHVFPQQSQIVEDEG